MENTNYDFDRICRACKAETSDLQSIFEINNSVKNESSKLSEMMMECTSVQILVGDGLPNSMCVQCVVKLKNAYDFKKQCEVTDTSLRLYMQQKKIKIEEQDDDSFDDREISDVLHEKIEPPHESVLSCAACPKKFTTLLGLKTHKKSHEKENSLKCKICLKEFTYYSHLQRHMNIHNPQKIYICKICEKRLTRLEHLKRHMVTHLKTKPHACRICKRGFNHIENLYNHEKRCKGDKKYVCEICNRGFTRADALEAHMGNHEQAGNVKPMLDSLDNIDNYIKVESFDGETVDIQDFIEPQVIIEDFKSSDLISKCEKTNLEIPEEELLKLNVACSEDDLKLTELADIPIVRKRGRPRKNEVRPPRNLRNSTFKATNCRVCQRKFKRLSHLQRHMLSHGESKAFQCELCWKTFGRKDHMVRHMKLHSVKKEFKCELCSREFVREEQLIQHKAVKHDIGQRIVVEKKYKCPICTKSFTTEKYRDIHVEAHGKEKRKIYDCKNCHLIFNSKEEFAEHEKQSPECSKKFLCSECGQRFIRKNYLIVHMRRHRGEKPFKCKYCGKGFPRSTDVTRHEKYHTGEKNHLCIICGKGFGRAYNLTLHMRTHTGEKPYHCSYCDAAFAQSNDLKSHTRRHTGERYHCDLCTDTFLMGYLLKQHKRNVHGLDLPSQRVQPAHVLQSMQNMQQAVQNAMPAMPIPRPS